MAFYGPKFGEMKKSNQRKIVSLCCKRRTFTRTTLLKHIAHNFNCKAFYGQRFEEMKKENQNNNQNNMNKAARKAYQKEKMDSDANLARYYAEIEFGPEFICICCHASLDENQVLEFTEERKEKIGPTLFKDCCDKRKELYDTKGKGRYFICKYCFQHMTKKKSMPNRCFNNGLIVEEIPEYLSDITGLENSLIAKYLLFLKISKVPKSGIELMVDRTVLVPVEPDDIMESIETTLLPRTMAESAVVAVDFKRRKEWKNVHQSGCIRPVKLIKALAFLKENSNPHYQDVILRCVFCDRQFEDADTDVLEHVEQCHLKIQANEEENEQVANESEANDDDDDNDDEIPGLLAVKKYQALDDVSCIQVNNPEVNVIVNTSNQAKKVPIKDSVTGASVVLAPGEVKDPSVIMREIDFDAKGFPLKHPSGNYGLHFEQPFKISKQQYFRTRLFHYSGIFSKDNDYLFMSQQFVERAAIEGQISISGIKGIMSNGPGGTKSMKLTDAFSVFQKIPRTPKYWQQKRNNLLAMINVLGPFQWFFTFSCAELR
jgi:hypothetical protein